MLGILILWFSIYWFVFFILSIYYTLNRQKCNNCDKVTIFDKHSPYCSKCWTKNI